MFNKLTFISNLTISKQTAKHSNELFVPKQYHRHQQNALEPLLLLHHFLENERHPYLNKHHRH